MNRIQPAKHIFWDQSTANPPGNDEIATLSRRFGYRYPSAEDIRLLKFALHCEHTDQLATKFTQRGPYETENLITAEYTYFPPSKLIEGGFIKAEDLKGFAKKRILSIGSGPGDFETFLVLCGTPKENITTSDISEEYRPEGFEHMVFDCWGQWPDFDSKFDFILYPNSVFGDVERLAARMEAQDRPNYTEVVTQLYYDLFKLGLANLNPGGSIRAQTLRRGFMRDHNLFAKYAAADGYKIKSGNIFTDTETRTESTGIKIDLISIDADHS